MRLHLRDLGEPVRRRGVDGCVGRGHRPHGPPVQRLEGGLLFPLSPLSTLPSVFQDQEPLTPNAPLKSGASSWTKTKREAFANDIDGPQLWAVTDEVNQSKSDQGPEDWKPSVEGFHCTYAKSWVQVKSDYDLTVTEDEKAALSDMLDSC